MSSLLFLPVAGPIFVAGVLLTCPTHRNLHRILGLGATVIMLGVAGALLHATWDGSVLVERAGGWPPGVAIGFAADPFAALMFAVAALVVLACLAAAAATGDDHHPFFVPLVLVLSAGAYGAFLTTDLFNFFVLVEVMLAPSYVLFNLNHGRMSGSSDRLLSSAQVYIATNLFASTVLLAGVGLLYGVTGGVQLGQLAGAARDSPLVAIAGAVVLLALATKSAVAPLHDWLPRTYPEAPPVVTALFSGLLTKVGLYAVVRVFAVVFEGDSAYHWLLGFTAMISMLLGVLGAVGEHTMRRVLSFHMVSQIGYVLLGLALFTAASLSAAIFYLVQYILVKTALFLCAAAVHVDYRTDRLDQLGGLAARRPILALAFAGAALSLAGLPPFSGFWAKFLVMRAAAQSDEWFALALAVVVSLFTLTSMLKMWSAAFWGNVPVAQPRIDLSNHCGSTLPALTLAALSLLLGLVAQPLLTLTDTAAAGLLDTSGYVRAVTGR